MIRVRICTMRCRCHNSCRRSRFSPLGTQILGKRFSISSSRRCGNCEPQVQGAVGKPSLGFSTAPSVSTTLFAAEFSFTLRAKIANKKKRPRLPPGAWDLGPQLNLIKELSDGDRSKQKPSTGIASPHGKKYFGTDAGIRPGRSQRTRTAQHAAIQRRPGGT